MPRRRKIYGICPYCGQHDKLTRDHVIPQCLFPTGVPLPGDLPKVCACQECNNKKKSGDDAYLRDLLTTDMFSSKSPIAKEHFAPFNRSRERNQSQLSKDMKQTRPIELRTPSGIIAGVAYTSPVVGVRMTRIFDMIIRGLYYYYLHLVLPETTPIVVLRVKDYNNLKLELRLLQDEGAAYIKAGNGDVFEGVFLHSPDQLYKSGWVLNFYHRVAIKVFTGFQSSEQQDADDKQIVS